MGARRGQAKVAVLAAAIALPGIAGVGVAEAAKVVCGFATECVGTRKADTIRSAGQSNVAGKGGNDTIVDSGGASVILGGPGHDTIEAKAGANLIEGGNGDDTIRARNGEADGIDCGKGTDTVTFDVGLDAVENCEKRRS